MHRSFFLLLALLLAVARSEPQQLTVFHGSDNAPLEPRGILVYDPTSTKRSVNRYESSASPEALSRVFSSADDEDNDMTTLYRVSVKDEEGSVQLNASVPLCLVRSSGYRDQFTLHLSDMGSLWHLDYLVSASECQKDSRASGPVTFKSKVEVAKPVEGARPILEQIVQATPDGKPPPEKTFLQKYWMYILPIVIILVMGGGGEEPRAAGGRR
ncbi:hypothetical protein HK104_009034 [Borealophlyctis nickersoniae]|nr:hypothetical protein HK104_009034 [Borealophlyctis nickersoniae]